MLQFCPACEIEVQFEQEEDASYCSQCGRTVSAAIAAKKSDRERKSRKKRDLAIWIVGVPAAILGLIFFVGLKAVLGTLLTTVVATVGTVSIVWVINKLLRR